MGNVLLASILLLFSVSFFSMARVGNGLREAFYGFDTALLEACVSIRNTRKDLSHHGEYVAPYFMRKETQSVLVNHLSLSFSDLREGAFYRIKVTFGRYQAYMNLKNIFVTDYPQEVTVEVRGMVYVNRSFVGKRTFVLEEGKIHGN